MTSCQLLKEGEQPPKTLVKTLQVRHDDLKEAAAAFLAELAGAGDFLASQRAQHAADHAAEAEAIGAELRGMAPALQQGLFADPDAAPAEVLRQLEPVMERLSHLKASYPDCKRSACSCTSSNACKGCCGLFRAGGRT